MNDLIALLLTRDGLTLAVIIFSAGVGIGAAVVQTNSILRRKASDAVTSIATWLLLLVFSLAVAWYLWHSEAATVLPSILGVLAFSSAVGLLVSIRARSRLSEIEAARKTPSDAELVKSAEVLRATFRLKRRFKEAREQRAEAH